MAGWQIPASVPQLLRRARELSGIALVDTGPETALQRLLHSLNNEAQLNDRGAQAIEQRLLRLLCNRLRMQRDIRDNPEILKQDIGPVLLVTGNPRTGSTKLQKLLAASGDFKYLPFWQVHSPALLTGDRHENTAPRIADAETYVRWIAEFAPGAQANHGYGTFEPEEEAIFLEQFIGFIFPSVYAHVPSFLQWWASQDFTAQAEYLKQGLQYLQWQFHDGDHRPWLLKAPMYFGFEEVLDRVFPGSSFVITHRDPANVVPSTANLVHGYRQGFSDVDYRKVLGASFVAGITAGTGLHSAVRERRPDLKFLDISYARLTQDSLGVVADIYARAGKRLEDLARVKMREWEARHAHDGQRPPDYALADFGLTTEMIAKEFATYDRQFRPYF